MKFVAIRSSEDGTISIHHQKNKRRIIKAAIKAIKYYLCFYDNNYEIVINRLDRYGRDYAFYQRHMNKGR